MEDKCWVSGMINCDGWRILKLKGLYSMAAQKRYVDRDLRIVKI